MLFTYILYPLNYKRTKLQQIICFVMLFMTFDVCIYIIFVCMTRYINIYPYKSVRCFKNPKLLEEINIWCGEQGVSLIFLRWNSAHGHYKRVFHMLFVGNRYPRGESCGCLMKTVNAHIVPVLFVTATVKKNLCNVFGYSLRRIWPHYNICVKYFTLE